MISISKYLQTAREFYERASKELEIGEKEEDEIRIRDAAEKAWNAVVQATNALFKSFDREIPKSHYERRKKLSDMERQDEKLKGKAFRDRYAARESFLHQQYFYDGIYRIADVKMDVEKVKGYIDDAEELISSSNADSETPVLPQ